MTLYASPAESASSAARIAASATSAASIALNGLSPQPSSLTCPRRRRSTNRATVVLSRSPNSQLGRITVKGKPRSAQLPEKPLGFDLAPGVIVPRPPEVLTEYRRFVDRRPSLLRMAVGACRTDLNESRNAGVERRARQIASRVDHAGLKFATSSPIADLRRRVKHHIDVPNGDRARFGVVQIAANHLRADVPRSARRRSAGRSLGPCRRGASCSATWLPNNPLPPVTNVRDNEPKALRLFFSSELRHARLGDFALGEFSPDICLWAEAFLGVERRFPGDHFAGVGGHAAHNRQEGAARRIRRC